MLRKLTAVFGRYPLTRGMAAYAIIWPIGSCVQQKIAGKELDLKRVARFCAYGSLYVAPTLYLWVRFSGKMWPAAGWKTAIKKALIEQVTYGPFAMVSFFSIMTLMEGGTLQQAKQEVEKKFLPTFKIAVCVWPVVQTVNFTFVPERNRVVFVSIASTIWTSFLAYVGVCVWPVLQTINFSLVPERNRVIFVACCSLLWTSFLAYMKYLDEISQKIIK